jgi:hypothetical protein
LWTSTVKIVIPKNNVYNSNGTGPQYSAYVTFEKKLYSALAILAID